jgi:hypothetical protein
MEEQLEKMHANNSGAKRLELVIDKLITVLFNDYYVAVKIS